MKTLQLALCLALASLTACAAHTPKPHAADTFLGATTIEGKHATKRALMEDPESTVEDLNAFGDEAEAAVGRCNIDKAKAREALRGGVPC